MASDYVREHPEYVRGMLEDSIIDLMEDYGVMCRRCNTRVATKSSCYSVCPNCNEINRSCGD